jgi:hypothetical protein
MTIGTSLFVIAFGAILRFAVTKDKLWGIQLDTAGLILMIVGGLGLILGLWLYSRARAEVVTPTRTPPPPA